MGVERKSMMMSDREKKNTAYHESGHTIVAAMLPAADPLHKVTIIPRGRALGLTQQLPDRGQVLVLEALPRGHARRPHGRPHRRGGVPNEITTGAGNDIERATGMARKMVCEWGMSELGPVTFGKKEQEIFLGREFAQHGDFSEVHGRRDRQGSPPHPRQGLQGRHEIITANRSSLERIARKLLERETLDGWEVKPDHHRGNGHGLPEAQGVLPGPEPRRGADHRARLRPVDGRGDAGGAAHPQQQQRVIGKWRRKSPLSFQVNSCHDSCRPEEVVIANKARRETLRTEGPFGRSSRTARDLAKVPVPSRRA